MANPVLLGASNAPQAKSMMTALTGLVEDGGRVGQIHSDRKVFTPITASVKASYSYNGYFKITDASEHDESGKITQTRVAIIDGGLGSSNMPCRVNNSVFYVPSKNDMEVSGNETVILLKFDADTKTFSYEAKGSLPSDTQNIVYYQIGRVKVKDNRLVIQQDHTTGVIQLWWFRICQEEEIK